MTLYNLQTGSALCPACSHDLVCRNEHNGEVRCSNTRCKFHNQKVKTGPELNGPPKAAA